MVKSLIQSIIGLTLGCKTGLGDHIKLSVFDLIMVIWDVRISCLATGCYGIPAGIALSLSMESGCAKKSYYQLC